MTPTLKERLITFAAIQTASKSDEAQSMYQLVTDYVDYLLGCRPDAGQLAPSVIDMFEEAVKSDENVAAVVREQIFYAMEVEDQFVPELLASWVEGSSEPPEDLSPQTIAKLQPLQDLVAEANGAELSADQAKEVSQMVLRYHDVGEPLGDATRAVIDLLIESNHAVAKFFAEQEEIYWTSGEEHVAEMQAALDRIPKDLPKDQWLKALAVDPDAWGKPN